MYGRQLLTFAISKMADKTVGGSSSSSSSSASSSSSSISTQQQNSNSSNGTHSSTTNGHTSHPTTTTNNNNNSNSNSSNGHGFRNGTDTGGTGNENGKNGHPHRDSRSSSMSSNGGGGGGIEYGGSQTPLSKTANGNNSPTTHGGHRRSTTNGVMTNGSSSGSSGSSTGSGSGGSGSNINNSNGSNSRRSSGNGFGSSSHSTPESRPRHATSNGHDGSQVYFDLKQPLPKLPVPDLDSTLDKYLTLLKTVITSGEFAHTKRLVEEFCKPDGDGPKLQGYLLRRQEERDNWANEYWLYDMYLNIRIPLIINSNPAAVFRRMTFFNSEDQIKFAARFILGMLDFKQLTDTHCLPVERCSQRENARPMCMSQHSRLMSSMRLPGRTVDTHIFNSDVGNDFIVVACRNQYFRINVQQDDKWVTESSLISQMTHAMTLAKMSSNRQPLVGLLTSQCRDVWAHQRKHLMEDSTNRSILSDLENCVCLVCFDENGLGRDMASRTHHIIHGGGSLKNTANRWMDKTIQVIVSEDGTCGITVEHSMAEGIALGTLIEHVFTFMSKEPDAADAYNRRDTTPILPTPLVWNISPQTMAHIQKAAHDVDGMIDDCDLSVVHFKDFGREFIKSQKVSPDAFIQLALQLTYYKIHQSLTSTYESASVRRFRHGRVDVIRANSPPALTWIKAMLGLVEATEEAKLQHFMAAVEWQQEYTQNAIHGHGVDLHIVGLREAAVDLDMPTPAIFDDPAYKAFNNFKLSTSQVMTKSDYWMGYGAVVPDGYGCCYNPKANSIIFSVGSFFSCDETSSDMFTGSLESSLNQMAELCKNVTTASSTTNGGGGAHTENGSSRGE